MRLFFTHFRNLKSEFSQKDIKLIKIKYVYVNHILYKEADKILEKYFVINKTILRI